ncbi:uncharacterized protein TRUGW13939_03356 [Talaromyces rugulosus]|uniref:CCZ1/INTU/HSP4 first Longin domain-containing protein n=1 Tax=Talaromyces rugulosus TaxID=121627 RepID=A0A7H8QS28_TALRU|nr:uncharacterized protein TRUGW13939_03356 [Talaromyces rugulosus]QKX56255.1 hypothetical protein TRUGW13939_03356 [Talaromyces rugulosus]
MTESEPVSVVPAQLAFLTIYNPSLGNTDETIEDQIVFYSSQPTRPRSNAGTSAEDPASGEHKDDTNQRLRQVGLAQGMVNFAKNFSGGKAVDNIETEKSRVVLDELETGWWILVSIDLTRLPSSNTSSDFIPSRTEYSSRELFPPQSIIQQLRRAHSIFLLHHDISLDNLYKRVGRQTFCKFLNRFWSKFIRNWLVLLNGNPAVDIFNGIKLALGGELGIGVGEEEWGSGEREVLEDFVSRTNGLVDLVVSRFGDIPEKANHDNSNTESETQPWLGSDHIPQPSDGVIFSGVGSLSQNSLARISHWMEWIYRYGGAAYGVDENPASVRRQRKTTKRRPTAGISPLPHHKKSKSKSQTQSGRTSPGIPPPLVIATAPSTPSQPQTENQEIEDSMFGTEALMKYLTLGYGSAWKFPNLATNDSTETTDTANSPGKDTAGQPISGDNQTDESLGKFIIGLKDDLEEEMSDEDSAEGVAPGTPHVQGEAKNNAERSYKKLQVLVYVRRPFMFIFLFDLRTPSLSLPSFYRSIHHQLGPLQRPLLSSTSPHNVYRRIQLSDAEQPGNGKRALSIIENPIYDLIYDPSNLTVRSSIPNIPEPGIGGGPSTYASPFASPGNNNGHDKWTRVEALNVHSQFLSTYTDTRSRPLEMERTCKTSRGWWLVWVRVNDGDDHHHHQSVTPSQTDQEQPASFKEAFLVRKASDSLSSAASARQSRGGGSSGVRFLRDLSGASSSLGALDFNNGHSNTAPGKLAEGLGLDAHKYIESLLSLNK